MSAFTRGLHEVGDGLYAWLQPDGGWGWSNAGLVTAGGASLLVDTLFDLRLTSEMLAAMAAATPAAARIGTLVNTHANGDHCLGNQLVGGARIVASAKTAENMRTGLNPAVLNGIKSRAAELGALGRFVAKVYGPFDLNGITVTLPDQTFTGSIELRVDDLPVWLHEVGPAHTAGDTLVHVPARRVVYAGDIVFHGSHPVIWSGPVGNWIAALDRILEMDVEVVVPGHGPLADLAAVRELKDYLLAIAIETRTRFEAGLSAAETAQDLPLGRYAMWSQRERVIANVMALYAELAGTSQASPTAVNSAMAEFGGF
jgi:cyclase